MEVNIFEGITGGPRWNWDEFTRGKVFSRKPGYMDIFEWEPQLHVPRSEATELWLLTMTDDMGSWISYKKPRDGLILPTKKFEAKYFNFSDGATKSHAMNLMTWEIMEWLGFGPYYCGIYCVHQDQMCTIRRIHDRNAVVLLVTVPSVIMRKTSLPMRAIPLSKIDPFLNGLPRVVKRQEFLLRKVLNI